MQEKHLFEYAVIRVMPRVEREEFINVGVILYCAKQKFLKAIFTIDDNRLEAFSRDLDIEEIEENLVAFERISAGAKGSGTIGQYDRQTISIMVSPNNMIGTCFRCGIW